MFDQKDSTHRKAFALYTSPRRQEFQKAIMWQSRLWSRGMYDDLPPNGLALSRAAPIEQECVRANTNFQKPPDLDRRLRRRLERRVGRRLGCQACYLSFNL